ncbi:SsrA-binding protein SmpB [Patescibacteria group bacterium]|nr:SsrA-binding protein SmpB [Patescibacteria group bacterium]
MPTFADNKKALFEYEILEKMEAGLELSGAETKSVKAGHMSLKGAYVTFRDKDAWLLNGHISPYKPAGPKTDYDPTRSRRLLLHKREIDYLRGKSQEKGLTIVPISVYNRGRFIKVEIAVARGKHTFDKRETVKKRDQEREMRRIAKDGV